MVDFATSIIGIAGATLIPVYISLYLITNLKFINIRYIAAAAVGLAFWFFSDTINDATYLDVNSSFGGGLPHVGLVFAFVLGVVTLALFDHIAVPNSKVADDLRQTGNKGSSRYAKLLFLIPAAIAVVSGIHGLGEGSAFGAGAFSTGSQSLVDAFGGLSAIASYPLHKFLEAGIIAGIYSAYVERNNLGSRAKWHLPVLGLLFGLPSIIGAILGYNFVFDPTYFYAFGVTAALYAVLRAVEALSPKFRETIPSYLGGKVFLALLIGILLLYGAALFH